MNAPVLAQSLRGVSPAQEPVSIQAPSKPVVAPQDWEKLVSPGHVLGRRTLRAGRLMFVPALAVFVAVGFLTLNVAAGLIGFPLSLSRLLLPMFAYGVPQSVRQALIYNPDAYTDLQGGVRTSYRYLWLTGIPRSRGLSVQGWTDLGAAVSSDLRSSRLETDKWTATPALATAPKVTRPVKALTEHVSRLDTGIVTVSPPDEQPRVHVVAMVDGAWAWTTFAQRGPQWVCVQSFGPRLPGCLLTGAIPEINDLRPASN